MYIVYSPPNFNLDDKDFEHFEKLNPVIQGWGDFGHAVTLPESITKKTEYISSFNSTGYSLYISDRISPNRSLEDLRPKECMRLEAYQTFDFGTLSIVIIFNNEAWSALIRTIWSVINRTPSRILKEIILVDDFSTHSFLKTDLEKYCDFYFKNIIKIIRLKTRQGLINARLSGAKEAVSDVLVFLDSHCEVSFLQIIY